MGSLVEVLVMVDAEHLAPARRGANPTNLRSEESRRHAGEDHKRRQSVEGRHAGANGIAWNLRTGPFDGKREGRAAEYAEVVRPVGILPDVLAVHHQEASKGLLQAGVEFVAPSGAQRRRVTVTDGRHHRVDDGIVAAQTGDHQVFIERRFQGARIGDPQHRIGGLDVVSDAEPRFDLPGTGQTVVKVAAQAQVKRPVANRDAVLEIQGEFLDVGMSVIVVQGSVRRGASIAGRQLSRTRQVDAAQKRYKIGIRLKLAGAQRRIHQRRTCKGAAVGVQADRVECGVYDPESVFLGQKRVVVLNAGLDVVDAVHIREIRVSADVGKRPVLAEGFALEVSGEVGKGIGARVVVKSVPPDKAAKRE